MSELASITKLLRDGTSMSDKAHKDQEQKAAEAEVEHFSQDLGPFVVAADTTRMPMVFTDAKKPTIRSSTPMMLYSS